LLDGVRIIVTKAVLASLVLGVVLAPSHRSHHGNCHRSHLSNWSHLSNLSNWGHLSNWSHLSHMSHLSTWSHLSNGSHRSHISRRDLVVLVGLSVREVSVVDLWSHHWLSYMSLSHILGNVVNRKVTCCNSKTKSIRNIVYSLSDPVSVHIAVGPTDDTVHRLGLLLGLVGAEEAVRVLTGIILSVVLRSYRRHHGLGNVVLSVVTGIGRGAGLSLGHG